MVEPKKQRQRDEIRATQVRSQGLILLLVVGVIISFFAIYGVFHLFAWNQTGLFFWWEQPGRLTPETLFQLSRTAVTMVGSLGLAAVLFLSFRRQRTAEQTFVITAQAQTIAADAYKLDVERRQDDALIELRSRYTKAAEQLGHATVPVQLAGVFAMASLADDWRRADSDADRQVCIDLLSNLYTYVNSNASAQGGNEKVRALIWNSIFDRCRREPVRPQLWSGATIDLRGGIFGTRTLSRRDFDFAFLDFGSGSQIESLTIKESIFSKNAETSFRGARVDEQIRFDTCLMQGGKILLSVEKARHNALSGIQFDHCVFNGSSLVLNENESAQSLSFNSCIFTTLSESFIGEVSDIQFVFFNCYFDIDVLSGLKPDVSARVEFIGCRFAEDLNFMESRYTH